MTSSSSPNLSNLPRHTLSVLLSYLQQHPPANNQRLSNLKPPHNRDAISLLITNKRFAYAILPLFRLPKHLCKIHQIELKNDGNETKTVAMVENYRFITLPIQDPRTLLDRLNTRRLKKRIVWKKQMQSDSDYQTCYQIGRSVEELSLEEWLISQIHLRENTNGSEDTLMQFQKWPAHLELLRFSGSTFSDDEIARGSKEGNTEKRIKKLFRFRNPTSIEWLPNCNPFGNTITLLTSYPRSGNSLMRTLLERITSTVTGSDTRPDRSLSIKLAQLHDLVGEGLVGKDISTMNSHKQNSSLSHKRRAHQTTFDPMVNIVKTHFPERKGWKQVTANRVILLVRNPYDAIDSYWNLCCTNTHTSSLDESVYEKYSAKFEAMAKHEIKIWCQFHYYWFDVCAKEGIPLLVVRYEDLVLNVEREMQKVLDFLYEDRDSTLDAFWKWRIIHATGQSQEPSRYSTKECSNPTNISTSTASLGSYRPRSSNGGQSSIGKSLRKNRYSESVLGHMHDVAVSLELERKWKTSHAPKQQPHMTLLQRFGYDIVEHGFPLNFSQPSHVPLDDIIPECANRNGQKGRKIQINASPEIRSTDDPFGRAMTTWRRGETNGDREPFPTVSR